MSLHFDVTVEAFGAGRGIKVSRSVLCHLPVLQSTCSKLLHRFSGELYENAQKPGSDTEGLKPLPRARASLVVLNLVVLSTLHHEYDSQESTAQAERDQPIW